MRSLEFVLVSSVRASVRVCDCASVRGIAVWFSSAQCVSVIAWWFLLVPCWADPRGNAIRGRPVDGVEQAHSTRPDEKNTGNFIGPSSRTVAEITLQRTDTTHDLSSESREAIARSPRTDPHLANLSTPNTYTHLHTITTFKRHATNHQRNIHTNRMSTTRSA